MSRPIARLGLPPMFFALAGLLLPVTVQAQLPDFPKVSLATHYEVDDKWPQKPEKLPAWGAMSGVAVDKEDRIWTFNRSDDPVQVYDQEGKFLRTWGRGVLQTAHHMKIGPDGNVWISDIGRHVVEAYTPAGERLLTLGTPGKEGCDETHLNKPTDMAITPSGDVFISDGYGNNRIVHYNKEGKFVKAWGEIGLKPGQFSVPHAIAV